MLIDVHTHYWGEPGGAAAILAALDAAGVDKVVCFSRKPAVDRQDQRASTDEIGRVAREAGGRIVPFVWIEPRLEGAAEEVERARQDHGIQGVKLIPEHWRPADAEPRRIYERAGELGLPILFHSGILYIGSDTSEQCRPVHYEVLLEYPKVRFALAHFGWPWTDECLAVCDEFRYHWGRAGAPGGHPQIWLDATSGLPRAWKVETLRKILFYLGPDWLMYGSDASATDADGLAQAAALDRSILREDLGVTDEALVEQIFCQNAERFLGG
jgi:hypothetical protein